MKKAYIQPVMSVMTMQHETSICTVSLGSDSVPHADHGRADRVDNCSADANSRGEWGDLWDKSLW